MAELQAQVQSVDASSELKRELEEVTAQLHSEQEATVKLTESKQSLKQVCVCVFERLLGREINGLGLWQGTCRLLCESKPKPFCFFLVIDIL